MKYVKSVAINAEHASSKKISVYCVPKYQDFYLIVIVNKIILSQSNRYVYVKNLHFHLMVSLSL
jgi:hypothetical protein